MLLLTKNNFTFSKRNHKTNRTTRTITKSAPAHSLGRTNIITQKKCTVILHQCGRLYLLCSKSTGSFSNGPCNLYLLMLHSEGCINLFEKGLCKQYRLVILYFLVTVRAMWFGPVRLPPSFKKFNSISACKHSVDRSGVWTKFQSRLVTAIRRKTNPRKLLGAMWRVLQSKLKANSSPTTISVSSTKWVFFSPIYPLNFHFSNTVVIHKMFN